MDSLSRPCSLPIDSGLRDQKCIGSAVSTGVNKTRSCSGCLLGYQQVFPAWRVLVTALTPTNGRLLVLGED